MKSVSVISQGIYQSYWLQTDTTTTIALGYQKRKKKQLLKKCRKFRRQLKFTFSSHLILILREALYPASSPCYAFPRFSFSFPHWHFPFHFTLSFPLEMASFSQSLHYGCLGCRFLHCLYCKQNSSLILNMVDCIAFISNDNASLQDGSILLSWAHDHPQC